MTRIGEIIHDWRWVLALLRARRARRNMSRKDQFTFDSAMQPDGCSYPEAVFLITPADVRDACMAVIEEAYRPEPEQQSVGAVFRSIRGGRDELPGGDSA